MKKLLLILLCLPMIGFGQQTYVPDANFKAYLVGNTAINTNGDNKIQVSEATAFNGTIDCGNMNITDLTGIEDFTNLEYLDCSHNLLISVDLTQNINLNRLYCNNNQLSILDVSINTSLSILDCSYNQLTSLNVTQNSALTYLWCNNNQISSIDITQNNLLSNMFCSNNQLTYLDLTSQMSFVHLFIEGNNLTNLDISHMQCPAIAEGNLSNPYLFCIKVTDVSCWNQQSSIWIIDTTFQYFSNNCSGTSIQEYTSNKELLKVTDLLGREKKQTNQPLFYLYNDGTVEKRIVIE